MRCDATTGRRRRGETGNATEREREGNREKALSCISLTKPGRTHSATDAKRCQSEHARVRVAPSDWHIFRGEFIPTLGSIAKTDQIGYLYKALTVASLFPSPCYFVWKETLPSFILDQFARGHPLAFHVIRRSHRDRPDPRNGILRFAARNLPRAV